MTRARTVRVTAALARIEALLLMRSLLVIGGLIEPLLPLHQVDIVLTREQLDDPELRRQTQEMLARARGNIPFA